jgi:carboxylesterase
MVKKILKKAKSILFADPKLLYRKDYSLISKPFYFKGTNGKAVLLIHGWTATPYEERRLGVYLNENGYTVSAPLMVGHGTKPQDLKNVKWTDWLKDVIKAYQELRKDYTQIYVIGNSLGANLVVALAKNRADIAGLVLLAMPYKIRMEKWLFFLFKTTKFLKPYYKKVYPSGFGSAINIARSISYQIFPTKSILEVFKLVKISRKELSKITQPCLIMQSSSDHVVTYKSLEQIYATINSSIKKKKYIDEAYHTFISDIKNKYVFQDILEFLKDN